jgi:Fe-S cluster biogenesis protein NfuA
LIFYGDETVEAPVSSDEAVRRDYAFGPMTTAVLECLEQLRPALDAHAGGIEFVGVTGSTVRLRFTGMCTGCHLRPLTMASTIRPTLLELAGVEAVEIEGSRISAEAEARLASAFGLMPTTR